MGTNKVTANDFLLEHGITQSPGPVELPPIPAPQLGQVPATDNRRWYLIATVVSIALLLLLWQWSRQRKKSRKGGRKRARRQAPRKRSLPAARDDDDEDEDEDA
jgi:type VI protein secretion system component VasK